MTGEPTREGWAPRIGDGVTLADVIERAFDYRGDVTVVRADGTQLVGYLFNRDADAREPFVQVFPRAGGAPVKISYADIRTIDFTGKDPAAGNSYAAWRERRDAARSAPSAGA
jgi:hypothetical protein